MSANSNDYEARGHSSEVPLSVSQLNWCIKNVLEQALPSVWAEGEVCDLSRPSSGHIYFSLKDDRSQIRAVLWRSAAERMKFELKDGLSIVCRGAVEVYPPRGTYQLIVNLVQPQGLGPLQLAFQQLHSKLSGEGLFDATRKRALPKYPRRIGFVTSPSGAAIHDFLEAARQRWNCFDLIIIPARVQGDVAKRDLVRGIQLAQRLEPALDLLIVGRGGGSLEDLWCFNEEPVVRALANCRLPTISAVGHEIDVTLCDLAANARALTPTHAAHLALPDQAELVAQFTQSRRRLNRALWTKVSALRQRLDAVSSRSVLARPHELHRLRRQAVDELELKARLAMWNLLKAKREKAASLARAAQALSPLNVLSRGYSLTRSPDSRQPIRSIDGLHVGDPVETVLVDGRLVSQVQHIVAESTRNPPP